MKYDAPLNDVDCFGMYYVPSMYYVYLVEIVSSGHTAIPCTVGAFALPLFRIKWYKGVSNPSQVGKFMQ